MHIIHKKGFVAASYGSLDITNRLHLHRRTNPEGPPAVLRNPLTLPELRSLFIQFSLTLRPLLEALGASAGLELEFFEDGASNTRIVTSPTCTSFGAFSCLSKNLNLLDFFGPATESSVGGVGGRTAGSAFKMSSGSKAGRAARRVSCVLDP